MTEYWYQNVYMCARIKGLKCPADTELISIRQEQQLNLNVKLSILKK